jgi:Na+-driven multidrug efflux pump
MNAPDQLGNAPVSTLFFNYYFPALTSILSSTVHQLVNGVILGQQVGKDGLAAVGLYGPVVIMFVAFTLPLMIGGGILISKHIGAATYDKAQEVFDFATTLALFFGGIAALSTPFVVKPLAAFLAGTHNTVLAENTADYIFWQLASLPFFFLRMFWGNFISHDNAPKISRNASLIAVAVNVVLDLLLIVVLDMGVKGASIATAVAGFAAVLYLFVYLQKGKNHFGFRHFRFTLQLKEWKTLLKVGFPSFASEVAFSSGLLLINQSILPYGPLAVSAFGLVNYVSFLFIRLFTAAMVAVLPIMSFNIGAKLPHRVLAILRFSLLFTFALGLMVTALGFMIPDLLISLFSGEVTQEFSQVAGSAMALYFVLFLAVGPNYILSAYLQSIGKATMSTLLTISKGFILIALFLLLLPGYFHMGLQGIWLSRSLAEILTLLLAGMYTFYHRESYYSTKVIVARE